MRAIYVVESGTIRRQVEAIGPEAREGLGIVGKTAVILSGKVSPHDQIILAFDSSANSTTPEVAAFWANEDRSAPGWKIAGALQVQAP